MEMTLVVNLCIAICICLTLVVLYSCYIFGLASNCIMNAGYHEKSKTVQIAILQPRPRPPNNYE